ncbi:DUF6346 domain-containing protein [Allokutzneria sp. A3M-2-11 16]|uniref:DUF6346 domain-containing protein n=1 Tax=Allokutzneria sp. A3M-2-11 16 TaxID=2962043 RepID=UPI0020B7D302|nr:DUF6346 domain-containing protein [Allokutzneria sp. A3M-2-11 16]MCP3800489.1 DUF6346 domain-containing protein [Allokutzneria sp. A3M-2-11 16]
MAKWGKQSEAKPKPKPKRRKAGWTRLTGTLLLVVVVGALGYLLANTALTANRLPNPSASDLRGTAVTQSCADVGPVSSNGFGTYARCTAEVSWENGTRETREFDGSELTAKDVGQPVRVVRVTTSPYQWLPAPESYQRDGGDRGGEWTATMIYAIVGAVILFSAAVVLGGLLSLIRGVFARSS